MGEEIVVLLDLIKSKPEEAVKKFDSRKKATEDFIKEYHGSRDIRDTQVEKIQKDKTISGKIIKKTKLKINYQKKIVRTATAFEVGEAATLLPNDNKLKLHEEVKAVWNGNRIDAKIQDLVEKRKAYTESALLFYMNDLKPDNLIGKILGTLGLSQKKEIKTRVLSSDKCNLLPYYDSNGDMIAFGYGVSVKVEGKDVKHLWIYTEKQIFKLDNSTGNYALMEVVDHGFGKIPIVYLEQELPEWEDVKELIDRYEVAVSKQSDSNDYSGHPIMIVEGEVKGAPNKEDVGKVFQIPQKYDEDGKKIGGGDIRFLTNSQAPESIKLEFETIDKDIHSISSTPNISFDNVKGIGSVSGIALKLLFLDAIIKAKSNEGENRTMYERIINIIISGIVTSVNTGLTKESTILRYTIQFNSILPDDLKSAADIVSTLRTAGVISKRTSVQFLKMVENTEEELTEIDNETKIEQPLNQQ